MKTILPLGGMMLVVLWAPASIDAQQGRGFKAVDHARTTIYHSPQKPGFTSWVGAWIMPDGDLMTCFTQATGPVKGRPQAPKAVQEKLNWPPQGAPNYDMTGLDLKNVHLRSSDAGKTWKEASADSFKSCMNGVTGEAQTALADGTVVRGVFGFYLPYDRDVPPTGLLQRSSDGTKTWSKGEPFLNPAKYTTWPRRLRVLRDGRVVALLGVAPFAAGSQTRAEFSKVIQPMLVVSRDNGKTWTGPIAAVPKDQADGWTEEFDIAELANGDLLAVFRRAGGDKRWQSVLKKSEKGWTAGKAAPSILPHSGQPELLATKEGPVLHVATSGVHWTDDAGKSWHKLGVPGTAYYPRSVQAKDGTIFLFGHIGGDDAYGNVDQAIVMDRFKLVDQKPDSVLKVGNTKHLTWDESLFSAHKGIRWQMHAPKRTGEKNIVAKEPWESWQIGGGHKLLKEKDRWRIWYTVSHGIRNGEEYAVAYAESRDGIHWVKPELGLVEYAGSKKNNLVLGYSSAFGDVFVDPNAPPAERYRMAVAIYAHKKGDPPRYLTILSSPDGLRWSKPTHKVLPEGKVALDTQSQIFWDRQRNKYLLFSRLGPWRQIGRSESDTPFKFPAPVHVMKPDNPVVEDYYQAGITVYEEAANAYLAFVPVFFHPGDAQGKPVGRNPAIEIPYNKSKFVVVAPDTVELHLFTSNDSIQWQRRGDHEPFIGLGPDGAFDSRQIYNGVGYGVVGDEIWLYYSGFDDTHTGVLREPQPFERRQGVISRATLRLDGFVSANAGNTGGELVTRPLIFTGDRLELNVDCGAGGHVDVELQSPDGKAIPGFSSEDNDRIYHNNIRKIVTWKGGADLSRLAGTPVRLRLVMRNARLYAFQFPGDAK